MQSNNPARITAMMRANVALGIVLSGRLVSSADCEIDSRPMKETMATVMPQPKFCPGDAADAGCAQLRDVMHERGIIPYEREAYGQQRDLAQ